ncbi:DUF6509 family protein [Bacillus sp. FJAT-50079]|uniref:DUF6509 family protein n=1 Tax=Bacillus sp. FJAT-50079 TaxID=2833577 RepID=UPI001BC8FF90|nr:DUF6509 family protein [Bacillus sp. FJAT-50079]MBS4209961.1 pullulanase [Bacillus sp. FJAT-50079]
MKIISHEIEEIVDPTGILPGERYEFLIHIELPEEDEAYTTSGLLLRVIFAVDEQGARISQYHFIEKATNQVLDFSMLEEEEQMIAEYCQQNL